MWFSNMKLKSEMFIRDWCEMKLNKLFKCTNGNFNDICIKMKKKTGLERDRVKESNQILIINLCNHSWFNILCKGITKSIVLY